MSREELEAELQANWNVDLLGVYADLLLAADDPRAELVAFDLLGNRADGVELDLHMLEDLACERWARVARMIGPQLAMTFPKSPTLFGFFQDLEISERAGDPHANLRALAATPMWPYVRGITMFGARAFVASALAAVADHHHPWLRRLSIFVRDGRMPTRSALATPAVVAELIDNTPILDTVQIAGRRVFEAFPHAAVTTWSLSHPDTIVSGDRELVTLRAPRSRVR